MPVVRDQEEKETNPKLFVILDGKSSDYRSLMSLTLFPTKPIHNRTRLGKIVGAKRDNWSKRFDPHKELERVQQKPCPNHPRWLSKFVLQDLESARRHSITLLSLMQGNPLHHFTESIQSLTSFRTARNSKPIEVLGTTTHPGKTLNKHLHSFLRNLRSDTKATDRRRRQSFQRH